MNSLSDRLPDTLRPCLALTVTYQGSHLRASQCRYNAAFHISDLALKSDSTALHLSSLRQSLSIPSPDGVSSLL
ncbi:hypothetical protein TNCV_2023721 [Trichonephila clavipes]|nr:hypothetical protein TNCV_2023721 [Trichonephila clavipes]